METFIKNEVKEITWPGKTFITVREVVPFDKLTAFFTENYGKIYHAIQSKGLEATEPPCAIYYSVDEKNMVTDLAAAVPVAGAISADGFETVDVPASKAVTITHYGSYDSMAETYGVLQQYIALHGYKVIWMIEEYLSDPAVEKDPKDWKTNIYFVLE